MNVEFLINHLRYAARRLRRSPVFLFFRQIMHDALALEMPRQRLCRPPVFFRGAESPAPGVAVSSSSEPSGPSGVSAS
jgi:hypothetical protein